MIIFEELTWSDAFSYGSDNTIKFTDNLLTQLVGKNGHGKTSIALILEEVLFNKNSKGIKKSDVINRYSKSKFYSISVSFSKDEDKYQVITKRGSTQSVSFFKNGEDISSHTSTATYKQIENVLGMDHKTFSQIVCQFGANSLQFLVDTDTNRKKFLVDLFSLTKYIEIGDKLKEINKSIDLNIAATKSKIDMAEGWLAKNSKQDLQTKVLLEVPEQPTSLRNTLAELKSKLVTLDVENKRRIQNNQYKKLLDSIVVPTTIEKPSEDINTLHKLSATITANLLNSEKISTELKKKDKPCPMCGGKISHEDVKDKLAAELTKQDEFRKELKLAEAKIKEVEILTAKYNDAVKRKTEFENYHSLFNPAIPSDLLDKDAISQEVLATTNLITSVEKEIARVSTYNSSAQAHNAKIEIVLAQIQEFTTDLHKYQSLLVEQVLKSTNLSILIKAFSTTGLIAYKLECLVKDLEDETNKCLNELSSGRFQLSFRISNNDKLNVVISDNGTDIDIAALSTGERARVNVATLLGIRKLLQSISKTKINLLFLDETIENLDDEGKEKLIEVLLDEKLNTILVSHGFSHPLLNKIFVKKNNNISRIEHG